MVTRTLLLPVLLLFALGSSAQALPDFKIEKIGRQVKEFQLDSINLSSPIDYYLSRTQVRLSGKYKNWGPISSSMFDYSADVPDEEIKDDFRNYILNETIDYIVTYRDSVASIVTHNEGDDLLLLNNCWLENGKWLNRGQGIADDWNEAQAILKTQLPEALI